jgi:hypothetical protein
MAAPKLLLEDASGGYLLEDSSGVIRLDLAGVTGTLALTDGADTIAATGELAAGPSTGTLTRTDAADTRTIAGTVATVGALAKSDATDTKTITGTHPVIATAAKTEAADTIVAAGTITAAPILGTLAKTEASDTLAADGVVTWGVPRSATLSRTDGADTRSLAASVSVVAALAKTEAPDTEITGAVEGIRASVLLTEGADTPTATGTHPVTASLAKTDSADTVKAGDPVKAPAVEEAGGPWPGSSGWPRPRRRPELPPKPYQEERRARLYQRDAEDSIAAAGVSEGLATAALLEAPDGIRIDWKLGRITHGKVATCDFWDDWVEARGQVANGGRVVAKGADDRPLLTATVDWSEVIAAEDELLAQLLEWDEVA